MAAPQTETSPVWQSYLDLANDVKPFMQWAAGSSTQDQQLQNTIDAACWWAQDFLGRPIAPTTFFRRFNGYTGWGGCYIDLPYSPVLGVPIVTEYWGASGPHTLTLQTPESQGGSDMFTLDSLRGVLTRSFLGLQLRPTFPGLANIEVTWQAGYNPIPPPWRRATLKLVKHWWDCDHQAITTVFQRQEGEPFRPEYMPLVPNDIEQAFATAVQVGIA